jgi:small nuclear ribonucleoprotein B and B'
LLILGEEKEVKRTLGLIILRGENIITLTAEAPPPSEPKRAGEGPQAGPGKAVPAGRGVPIAPLGTAPASGLSGPMRGVGGLM